VACLRKANHDPHQALEEFIEEVREPAVSCARLAEAVGSPEQLALEYLERVARESKGMSNWCALRIACARKDFLK